MRTAGKRSVRTSTYRNPIRITRQPISPSARSTAHSSRTLETSSVLSTGSPKTPLAFLALTTMSE